MEGNSLKLISKYRTYIMGFAALWILIFHAWTVVSEQYSFVWRIEYFIKKTGFAGVDIFFLVSGMGLVYAVEKYDVKRFYLRRFLNVYPAFFITGLIQIFTKEWDFITFLENVLCIHFFKINICQLLWFVPAILILYILFPWYYKLLKKFSSSEEFTICVLMVWLFLSIRLDGVLRLDVYGFTNRIPVFLMGVLIGKRLLKGDVEITRSKWRIIILGFLLGIYLSYYTNIKEQQFMVPMSNCCVPNFLIAVFGSILLAKFFWFLDNWLGRIGKGILTIFLLPGIASLELFCAQEEVGLLHDKLEISNVLIENIVVILFLVLIAVILYIVCKYIKTVLGKVLLQEG